MLRPIDNFGVGQASESSSSSFFDRFGRKEQTGIGGRSKAAVVSSSYGGEMGNYACAAVGSPVSYGYGPGFQLGSPTARPYHIAGIGGGYVPPAPQWSEGSPQRAAMQRDGEPQTRYSHHVSSSGAELSREEALLLMGVAPASTYRTSEVLLPNNLAGESGPPKQQSGMGGILKRRVVDFVGMQDVGSGAASPTTGGQRGGAGAGRPPNVVTDFSSPQSFMGPPGGGLGFFEEVDRLRQTNASSTSYGDTNVYGTPFHVNAVREAELRRRPSWDVDSFQSPSEAPIAPSDGGVMYKATDKKGGGRGRGGGVNSGPQPSGVVLSPPAPAQHHRPPLLPDAQVAGGSPARKPLQLEPLATQEAVELQRQLQKLNRRHHSEGGSFQSTGSGPLSGRRDGSGFVLSPLRADPPLGADAAVRHQLHPARVSPAVLSNPPTNPSPPRGSSHDTTNLPGAGMYGKAVPSVIADILAFHSRKMLDEEPRLLLQDPINGRQRLPLQKAPPPRRRGAPQQKKP